MQDRTATHLARLTGIAYLGIIACGLFAELAVRGALVVPGDAGTTASNLAAHAGLFRAGVFADLVMISLDVGVGVGLAALLWRTHQVLSSLAAALRWVQAATLAANLMNMISALQWATSSASALDANARAEMVLSSMQLHRVTYDLGLVFFGLSCVVTGALLWRSQLAPRILAVGLSIAGVVYLVGSAAAVIDPDLAASLDPLYGVAFLAELGVAGWLVIRGAAGARAPRPLVVAPV